MAVLGGLALSSPAAAQLGMSLWNKPPVVGACGALRLDHFTTTGPPAVFACDVIAMPLFGL